MFYIMQINADHSETPLAKFPTYVGAVSYARGLMNAGQAGIYARSSTGLPRKRNAKAA